MKKVVDSNNGMVDVYSVSHKRTFCYIVDAVKMIQLLAESEQSIGETYNIGNDDEEITMGDLAQKVIDLIGKKVTINPKPFTPGSPKRRCPSIKKLKKTIPYTKQYLLDKGLEETFTWYNANVFSCQKIYSI